MAPSLFGARSTLNVMAVSQSLDSYSAEPLSQFFMVEGFQPPRADQMSDSDRQSQHL
jgi:hypothetical protein